MLAAAVALALPGLAQNSKPQPTFDSANEQLENGQYEKALSLYHQLDSNNTVSGALFLNMGVAYYRSNSLGKAKYYLLKATQFEGTASQARKSLSFVNEKFSHQSAVLPKFPWDRAVDWLSDSIGAYYLLLIGIVLLNLGVILFVLQWFYRRYQKACYISGLSIIVVALLLVSCSFYTDYVENRYNKAVMVSQKVPVREKPDDESSLISQSFEGYTFTVDQYRSQSNPQWSYIRMSNGLYGWIPNDDILIL